MFRVTSLSNSEQMTDFPHLCCEGSEPAAGKYPLFAGYITPSTTDGRLHTVYKDALQALAAAHKPLQPHTLITTKTTEYTRCSRSLEGISGEESVRRTDSYKKG